MAKKKTITAKQVLELVKQQGYRCPISNRELTPETASLDHIVPLGRGGDHDISNVWIVHHEVNSAKGTLTLEEFVAMCRDIVRHQDGLPNAQSDTCPIEESQPVRAGPPTKTLFW